MNPRIIFACMPWATGQRPSIALAILKNLCAEAAVDARVLYPNLDFAALLGFEVAHRFADERSLFGVSEHLFACDLFHPDVLSSEQFLDAVTRRPHVGQDGSPWKDTIGNIDYLRHVRDEVIPAFLDQTAERVLALEPDVLGFTATFNQVMPSLALARRIKRIRPDVEIIAGGACFDAEMGCEYHRALPDVLDHVFLGEAEESFREYLHRKCSGLPTTGIPGVTSFAAGRLDIVPGRPLADMNTSPMPDYDDFFMECDRVREATGRVFNIEYLPFESARGCWWGARSQCTFCGINPELLGFRGKDVDRILHEIVLLSARYSVTKLTATDWIMSRWHRDELFRRLAELDLDIEIFYEIRADMRKDQVKAMRDAGILTVQPGIESFSTDLLRLMGKGTSAIRHVQFLRWCREYGIHASYNILGGFPNERLEWYDDMVALIPRLTHLQPPLNSIVPIEMHRFAPLHEDRDAMGVDHRGVRPDYGFLFPHGSIDPLKFAYFFEHHSVLALEGNEHFRAVEGVLEPWIEQYKNKELASCEYALGPGFVRITDTRLGEGRYVTLRDLHHDVFLLCDEIQNRRQLHIDLSALYPNEVADGTLDAVIDELVAADLLLAEGKLVLALPIAKKPRLTEELRAYVLQTSAPVAVEDPVAV